MAKFFKEDKDNRGVTTITLNRPNLHNAFNDAFIDELINCFDKLSKEDDLRVVVLTGAGRSFCAGADLNWMKKMKDYSSDENYQDSVKLANLFEVINSCPVPVIAKVNGAALGGGTGLIAVCDYAIACQSAKLGFTEVCLGLVPAVISPFVISRIGIGNARAYFLSGETFLALTAKRIGLIHHVCPLDDLDDQTEKIINRFLKAGPKAARVAKSLVFGVDEKKAKSRDEMRKYTCETISKVRTSDEGQEGMAALLEKRSPSWKVDSKGVTP